MKIENKLCQDVKNMQGFLLGIGVDIPKILEEIEKNNAIRDCALLSTGTGEKGKDSSSEIIHIKDFRKKWKRKKVDYIIACSKEILPYIKYFVKDSIYINKKRIYIFDKEKENIEIYKKKYQRYIVEMEVQKCKDGYILMIENKDYKRHFIKDPFYLMVDTISDGIDQICEILNI